MMKGAHRRRLAAAAIAWAACFAPAGASAVSARPGAVCMQASVPMTLDHARFQARPCWRAQGRGSAMRLRGGTEAEEGLGAVTKDDGWFPACVHTLARVASCLPRGPLRCAGGGG
jgi:hypothetical protein